MLALLMVVSILPADVLAQENSTGTVDYSQQYVVLSVEGLTIGQGYYVEPQKLSYEEIGTLLADEGIEVSDLSELTAAEATVAFFLKEGITADYGSTSEFYMSSLHDVDTTQKAEIPEIIASQITDEITDNTDNNLDAFDYTSMLGWMFTVNHSMPNVGANGYDLKQITDAGETPVIRWQFSVYGYGADIGFGWDTPYYTAYDKSDLYTAYADNIELLDQYPTIKTNVMDIMTKVDATEEEIAGAVSSINNLTPQEIVTKDIQVNVYDYTAVDAGISGASTDGVVMETTVTINENQTATDAFKKACEENEIPYEISTSGWGSTYISSIHNLAEYDGGDQSGWMVEYNQDGTNNLGLTSLTLTDGDTLDIHYSLDYGVDLAAYYVLPILHTLTVGDNDYEFRSETTYDANVSTTTYYINDGVEETQIPGAGTQEDPFLVSIPVEDEASAADLVTSYTTAANSHYVTVEGLDGNMDLTTPQMVTITGKSGNTAYYSLQAKMAQPVDIADAVASTIPAQIYNGEELAPDFTLTMNDQLLEEATDYEIVNYDNEVDAGIGTITVEGIGDYTGTKIITYKITRAAYKILFNKNNSKATGSMPALSMSYDVSKKLTANKFKLSGYTFAGWSTTKSGKVVYKNQKSVENLAKKNGATINLYAVWIPNTYKVAFYDNSSKATGKMSTMTYTYNKAGKLATNKFKLAGYDVAGWATSAKGKVAYKNAASIKNLTTTAGKTIKLYAKWMKTTVNTATISSVKSSKAKAMTVKWKKVSGADGYVISYTTDKNMKKNVKNVYVSKGTATSQTIKNLKAGKKYYITVKAYEKDSAGKRVVGKCKAKKAVTIKKSN